MLRELETLVSFDSLQSIHWLSNSLLLTDGLWILAGCDLRRFLSDVPYKITMTSSSRFCSKRSSSLHLVLDKCACFTSLEKLRPIQVAEEFDQLRDDTGPARLVAGPKTRPIVTVEIFVEQDVISPLGIGLKFFRTSIHRPPARPISQKDPG